MTLLQAPQAQAPGGGSPASATHPEYRHNAKRWGLVRDVIKSDISKYIRDVDPSDVKRVEQYRESAMFTNFTARTKMGLLGAVFRKDLIVTLPEPIAYMEDNATGTNITLTKLAQEITGEVLQAGRYGLLVDFPTSDDDDEPTMTKTEGVTARVCKYTAESIINWKTDFVNGNQILSLVVLKEECNELSEDGFTWEKAVYYRVLRMVDGVYNQMMYDNTEEDPLWTIIPTDFEGNTWNYIPFVFVGSEDNDSEIDISPLYDLARLNIGHLRNSADYEESVYLCGQPTLFITTEMDSASFKDANPSGVLIGARRGHNLGPGGSATFLQASPNQLADAAMKRKEDQAIMIGARIITPQTARYNETATAATIRNSSENSMLTTIVQNVQAAIITCLEYALKFMGDEALSDQVQVTINDQFFDPTLDPNMIMAQLQLVNSGVIAKSDLRNVLRKYGAIEEDRTDDELDADINSEAKQNPMSTKPGGSPIANKPDSKNAPASNPVADPTLDANPNPLSTPIMP